MIWDWEPYGARISLGRCSCGRRDAKIGKGGELSAGEQGSTHRATRTTTNSTRGRKKNKGDTDTAAPQVVIIQPVDNGSKTHPYGHALVAGIERYPSKITRRMSKKRQEKRNKVKPFIKIINYNHLMPTRYTLELEGLKSVVTPDTFKEVSQREEAKKTVKKVLEERYTSGKNRWFFTPLRMLPPCSQPIIPPRRREGRTLCANRRVKQGFDRFLSSVGWAGRTVFFGLYTASWNKNLRLTS